MKCIRWVCCALAALACAAPVRAQSTAPDGAPVTIYASLLGQPAWTKESKPGDQLQFYCSDSFEPLSADNATYAGLGVCSNERLKATRGKTIEVRYVFVWTGTGCPSDPGDIVMLEATEVPRKTLLASELKEVVGAISSRNLVAMNFKLNLDGAPATSKFLCWLPLAHVLQRERATVNMTVTVKATGDTKDVKNNYTLVTGPAEHWFVTGDAVVRGVKELKYDSTSKTVVERDKPQQFYVGFNYMLGDVLTKYPQLAGERVVVKLMLSPTKHPFDSIGAGVGYRLIDGVFQLPDGKSDNSKGDVSGGLVLFVGHFWSKNDKVDAATDAVAQSGRSQSWRVGLSYDVSTLLGWLK